jgi:hypothetical protein
MIRSAIAWLSSDRGLLVVGTSLLLGGLVFLWADCLRLWTVRRKTRDMVDLLSTTAFTALIVGITLALRTFDSLPASVVGFVAAAVSYAVMRRFLRIDLRQA